jgi:hypothetical protein
VTQKIFWIISFYNLACLVFKCVFMGPLLYVMTNESPETCAFRMTLRKVSVVLGKTKISLEAFANESALSTKCPVNVQALPATVLSCHRDTIRFGDLLTLVRTEKVSALELTRVKHIHHLH